MGAIEQLSVTCRCGFKARGIACETAAKRICPACGDELQLPSLLVLRKQSENIEPPDSRGPCSLSELLRAIEDRQEPFHGRCQWCWLGRGTNLLPVTVTYVDNEETKTFAIPCTCCDLCARDVRRGLRIGTLKNFSSWVLKSIAMLFLLLVFTFIAIALPFLGLVFVLVCMGAVYDFLTRRRANPFLLAHLNHLCDFAEVMKHVERCTVKHRRLTFGAREVSSVSSSR